MPMKNGKFFIAAIFFLFLSTAFYARRQFIPSERLWPDEALYASQATEIGHNMAFLLSREANEFHVPLFSFFLSWGRSLIHPAIEGYRLLAIVFNWAGLLATFLLARNLLGVKTAMFALAFLALNRTYFNNAGFILVDSLLAATQVFFILSLYRMDRVSKRAVAFFLLSGLLMIYLKWYAILFIWPITAGYGIDCVSRQNKKNFFLWFFVLCLASIPILIKIFSIVKAGGPATFHHIPWWYYFSLYLNISGGLLPFIFFVYGALVLRIKKPKASILLELWLFVYLVVLSCVSEKDVRYVLPVMPCVAIISAFGLKCAIEVFFNNPFMRRAALKIIIVLLLLFSLMDTFRAPETDRFGYIGFFEAGEWIKKHGSLDTAIFAGSTRAIRFTTGIPLKRFGGRLEPLPGSLDDLRAALLHSKNIILEIDRWEYIQPQWAFPVTGEKVQALESLAGLHLAKVIYKNIKYKRTPVVWLFTGY